MLRRVMPAPDSHDAAIVGGGHNGLVAAACLARAGRSVLVLERLAGTGGAAVSTGSTPACRATRLVSLPPAHADVLLCGAGAVRGGGVSGIPGHNAAMAAPGR